MTYKIVRYFKNPDIEPWTIKTGLTLEEAQEHCRDPETSSLTAKGLRKQQITRTEGPWFDGYEKEE